MTEVNLSKLEALTRDYAAFQARKSGLATALGGLMACLLFWIAVLPQVFRVQLLQRPALEWFLLTPFMWLVLKALLARILYPGIGTVKAQPDPAYERRLARWTFGLALFLMVFLSVAIYGFVSGELMAAKPAICQLPREHPLFHPWAWLIWLPMAYLAPIPWAIRGVEEARAYAVLAGQCMIWLVLTFLFAFMAVPAAPGMPKAATGALALAFVLLDGSVLAWGALAIVRGWREHREYLAILKSLPREEASAAS